MRLCACVSDGRQACVLQTVGRAYVLCCQTCRVSCMCTRKALNTRASECCVSTYCPLQEELEQLRAAAETHASTTHAAVEAATFKARKDLQDAKAAAAAAAELHQQRAAQLNQRCSQLAEQAGQLEAALQQQVVAVQQTASARQQQILVRVVLVG